MAATTTATPLRAFTRGTSISKTSPRLPQSRSFSRSLALGEFGQSSRPKTVGDGRPTSKPLSRSVGLHTSSFDPNASRSGIRNSTAFITMMVIGLCGIGYGV